MSAYQRKLCSPGGVKGTNKEETRRVSDAANDKIESGEALPERSDRECDETEVPGAEAPDVTHCWLQKPHEGVRRQGAPA